MPRKDKQAYNEYHKNWIQKLRAKLKAEKKAVKPSKEVGNPEKITKKKVGNPFSRKSHIETVNFDNHLISEAEFIKRFYMNEALNDRDTYGDRNRAMSKRIEDILSKQET